MGLFLLITDSFTRMLLHFMLKTWSHSHLFMLAAAHDAPFFSFYQAQARCHRIGQSKAVKVYRLITRNSYEREMLDKASLKLGLDRAVLQSMSGNKDSNVNGVRKPT